jgi:hypothetical protein
VGIFETHSIEALCLSFSSHYIEEVADAKVQSPSALSPSQSGHDFFAHRQLHIPPFHPICTDKYLREGVLQGSCFLPRNAEILLVGFIGPDSSSPVHSMISDSIFTSISKHSGKYLGEVSAIPGKVQE